ncbi:hypothetical protein ACKKBG_A17425 [Auxenochlorella protothecoides x Auxenochlorella symbiontica]|uniref:Uncharacterized protein n=1 Tax=Auxenochlorella protothecoides TaxID=3075 RepID=A0A1D2A128_AUXPR
MADFLGKPFMGPASTPHVAPGMFSGFFIGAHVALFAAAMPGRFLGTEVRPRKFNREYIISCCNEAAQRRDVLRGQAPRAWYKGKPRLTGDSWEKMWNKHIHWKRWTQERMGPNHQPS